MAFRHPVPHLAFERDAGHAHPEWLQHTLLHYVLVAPASNTREHVAEQSDREV